MMKRALRLNRLTDEPAHTKRRSESAEDADTQLSTESEPARRAKARMDIALLTSTIPNKLAEPFRMVVDAIEKPEPRRATLRNDSEEPEEVES